MAVYDLEEQEQIAALRSWWKQYGGWATGVLLMVALAVLVLVRAHWFYK